MAVATIKNFLHVDDVGGFDLTPASDTGWVRWYILVCAWVLQASVVGMGIYAWEHAEWMDGMNTRVYERWVYQVYP